MFQHEGYSCLCAKDTVNTSPNETPTVTLKVCPDTSKHLLFSYAPKDGLNMTGVAGSLHEQNILGKLLALPKGDIDKHIEFIEKYGFLYPLPENEYTAIEANALIEIINRIKATIRLYGCINKKTIEESLSMWCICFFTRDRASNRREHILDLHS